MLTHPLDFTTPMDLAIGMPAIEELNGVNLLAPESEFASPSSDIISFTPGENLEYLGDDLTSGEIAQMVAPETDTITIPATELFSESMAATVTTPAAVETFGAITGSAEAVALFLATLF